MQQCHLQRQGSSTHWSTFIWMAIIQMPSIGASLQARLELRKARQPRNNVPNDVVNHVLGTRHPNTVWHAEKSRGRKCRFVTMRKFQLSSSQSMMENGKGPRLARLPLPLAKSNIMLLPLLLLLERKQTIQPTTVTTSI